MMRKLYSSLLLIIIFLFAGTIEIKASHVMGGDLTYTCLGNNQYKLTFQLYRDCSGVSAPSSVNIQISGCGTSSTVTLNPVGTAYALEVTPLCPNLKKCSECNPAPPSICPNPLYQGVEVYTYEATVTLPTCANLTMSYTLCCRNGAVTNVGSPSSQSIYIAANVNTTVTPCNNSPKFAELPTPYICANQLYNYNHGVLEPDGDSIAYTLTNSQTTSGSPIPFSPPYSISNPLATTAAGFNFGTNNGQMSFTPSQTQVAIMAVKVCEYRKDTLGVWHQIGCVVRDLQIVVINCPSNQIPPELGHVQNIGGGGYYLDTNSVGVCPGNTVTFDVLGYDLNSTDTVTITSNISGSINSTATYTVTPIDNDSAIISFTWTPSAADSGVHYFTITIKDDHCPVYSSQTYSYNIVVQKEVSAGPDVKYCNIGGPIKLEAKGGSAFHWTPSAGIVGASGPDSSWILVAPTQTTNYVVTSDCNKYDTVLVELVPSFTYTLTPDDTICKFESMNLDVNADPGFAPYTYSWDPSDSLSPGTTVPNVVVNPLSSTTYNIQIISKDGCEVNDSVEVTIKGESPRVSVTASKEFLCPDPNDQAQLFVNAQPGSCGLAPQPCTGVSSTNQIGFDTNLSGLPTPYEGNWDKQRMQILYRASELNAMGIYGGTITSLAFEVGSKASAKPYSNFTIRMGCVQISELGTKFVDGLVEVLAPTAVTTTMGWNTHTLTAPYDWDGMSNLLVEICFTNPGSYTNDDDVYASATGYPSTMVRFADNISTGNTPGCELLYQLPAYNMRPNTQFTVCSQDLSNFIISWSPTNGLSDTTSGTPYVISGGMPKTTTYQVQLDNAGCYGYGDITIIKDTTTLEITQDTTICDIDPIQLNATVNGNPPLMQLTCGANGTVPVNPAVAMQVGNGTQSFGGTVFANKEDMRFQILYKATDLKAAGIKTGVITEYAIELATKTSSIPVQNFNIKMGCTNETEFNTSFISAPNLVYSNPNFNTSLGWNNFILDNTFDWDGISNIVVEICWDNPNGTPLNGLDQIKVQDVAYKGIIRNYGDNLTGCNISTTAGGYNKLPNTKFSVAPAPPGNFTYNWSPGSTLSDSTIKDPIASPLVTTTYVFSVNTEYNCILTDTVTIRVNDFNPQIDPDVAICLGDSVQLNASGGSTYIWNPTTGLNPPSGNQVMASPTNTTTYTVTITDSIGCTADLDVTVTVNPIPIIDAGMDDSVYVGAPIVLTASGGTTYQWSPANSLDNPQSVSPTARPLTTTTFTVVGTDINGCKNKDTVTIIVYSVDDIYIPSAFSPNGDGLNDIFYVKPKGLAEILEFKIINRWGETVYTSTDATDGWDGRYKNEEQEIGTYVYILVGRRYDGTNVTYRGNITLLR